MMGNSYCLRGLISLSVWLLLATAPEVAGIGALYFGGASCKGYGFQMHEFELDCGDYGYCTFDTGSMFLTATYSTEYQMPYAYYTVTTKACKWFGTRCIDLGLRAEVDVCDIAGCDPGNHTIQDLEVITSGGKQEYYYSQYYDYQYQQQQQEKQNDEDEEEEEQEYEYAYQYQHNNYMNKYSDNNYQNRYNYPDNQWNMYGYRYQNNGYNGDSNEEENGQGQGYYKNGNTYYYQKGNGQYYQSQTNPYDQPYGNYQGGQYGGQNRQDNWYQNNAYRDGQDEEAQYYYNKWYNNPNGHENMNYQSQMYQKYNSQNAQNMADKYPDNSDTQSGKPWYSNWYWWQKKNETQYQDMENAQNNASMFGNWFTNYANYNHNLQNDSSWWQKWTDYNNNRWVYSRNETNYTNQNPYAEQEYNHGDFQYENNNGYQNDYENDNRGGWDNYKYFLYQFARPGTKISIVYSFVPYVQTGHWDTATCSIPLYIVTDDFNEQLYAKTAQWRYRRQNRERYAEAAAASLGLVCLVAYGIKKRKLRVQDDEEAAAESNGDIEIGTVKDSGATDDYVLSNA